MWTAEHRKIADREGEILSIADGANALTLGNVIALWRGDAAFREFFAATLAASLYPAFFWELPPVERGAISHPFECVTIRSDALAQMRASEWDFAEHLETVDSIAVFPNLSGDAVLIAPRRIGDGDCYGHIAAFLREAPREQQHALFRCLSEEIDKRLASRCERFWVSTSGLGVPWMHVRLDCRPKYFQHRPYASSN